MNKVYDFLQLLSKPVLNTIDNDSEGLSNFDQEYYLSAWCREWDLLHIRLPILKNPFYLPTVTLTSETTGHPARLLQKLHVSITQKQTLVNNTDSTYNQQFVSWQPISRTRFVTYYCSSTVT